MKTKEETVIAIRYLAASRGQQIKELEEYADQETAKLRDAIIEMAQYIASIETRNPQDYLACKKHWIEKAGLTHSPSTQSPSQPPHSATLDPPISTPNDPGSE